MYPSRRAFLSLAAGLGVLTAAGCSQPGVDAPAGDSQPEVPSSGGARDEAAYAFGFVTTLGAAEELFSAASSEQGSVEELSYSCHAYAVEEAEGRSDLVVEKRLMVYLPFDYDPSQAYDVLYLLHGTAGDERYWLGEGEECYGQSTRNVLDALMARGLVRPTIVVAPTYYSIPEGYVVDTSLGGDDPYADLWPENFWRELRADVVPLVESRYATYAAGDVSDEALAASREHRAFAGLSRGSKASVGSVMMHALDWFSRIGSFSGAWVDFDEFRAALEGEMAAWPVDFWYNGNGSRDFSLEDHEAFVQRALAEMPDRFADGENCAWVCFPGGGHEYACWGLDLHNSLLAFFPA